jgi:hypothetical protein
MAITKTSELSEVVVTPAKDSSAEDTTNAKHPVITVSYFDVFNDNGNISSSTARTYTLSKFVEDDGDATDVSGEDTLIQTIATAIWS